MLTGALQPCSPVHKRKVPFFRDGQFISPEDVVAEIYSK